MEQIELPTIGWNPFFAWQVGGIDQAESTIARVSAHYGSQLVLLTRQGEKHIPTQLTAHWATSRLETGS